MDTVPDLSPDTGPSAPESCDTVALGRLLADLDSLLRTQHQFSLVDAALFVAAVQTTAIAIRSKAEAGFTRGPQLLAFKFASRRLHNVPADKGIVELIGKGLAGSSRREAWLVSTDRRHLRQLRAVWFRDSLVRVSISPDDFSSTSGICNWIVVGHSPIATSDRSPSAAFPICVPSALPLTAQLIASIVSDSGTIVVRKLDWKSIDMENKDCSGPAVRIQQVPWDLPHGYTIDGIEIREEEGRGGRVRHTAAHGDSIELTVDLDAAACAQFGTTTKRLYSSTLSVSIRPVVAGLGVTEVNDELLFSPTPIDSAGSQCQYKAVHSGATPRELTMRLVFLLDGIPVASVSGEPPVRLSSTLRELSFRSIAGPAVISGTIAPTPSRALSMCVAIDIQRADY